MTSNNSGQGRILIAEDREDTLKALRILLKSTEFEIGTATSPEEAIKRLGADTYDVLLMDMNYSRDTTSGREGLELLSRIRSFDSLISVVVMTAWSSVELAVQAMRFGANDFIEKPWENERLLSILRTQMKLVGSRRQGIRLAAENRLLRGDVQVIAQSASMKPVLEMIERVGPSDESILITGENGVGKGLIARLLHAASAREAFGFVAVNIGGLSVSIFESELFGHEAGAFTDAKVERIGRFELADKGTLFLDEIANVPPELQSKLLHVVETGEYERVGSSKRRHADVRLISATNAELDKEIAQGRFRQDLYFRLNTIEIRIPPLRDRPEDLQLLAMHFLQRHAVRYRRDICDISPAALRSLAEHPWPGNVRELDHAIARAVLMAKSSSIEPDDLGLRSLDGSSSLERMTLDDVERILIEKAMTRCSNNVQRAASELGLSRSALYRRLQRYGLYAGDVSEVDSDENDLKT